MSEPFYVDGMEWVRVLFHGQSFMLHQIRKMIGFAILAVKADVDASQVLPNLFGPTQVNIPKAPALGLLLDEPMFIAYNSDSTIEERVEAATKKKEKDDARWAAKVAQREAKKAEEESVSEKTEGTDAAAASDAAEATTTTIESADQAQVASSTTDSDAVAPPAPTLKESTTDQTEQTEQKVEEKKERNEDTENKNNNNNNKGNNNNKRKADKEIKIYESKRIKLGLDKIEFAAKDSIDAFKQKYLHEFIVNKEHENNDFYGWINFCDKHSFYFMPFLNRANAVREMFISVGGVNKSDL